MDPLRPSKAARVVVAAGAVVALAGTGALALAGFGYRWGWWPLPGAFAILRAGTFVAGGGTLVALIGAAWSWRRGARALAALAFVTGAIGAGAATLPLLQLRTAKSVPPIHDITTDPVDPPAFEAVLPLRAGAANSAEYGGSDVAAQQHAAYPDIVPIHMEVATDQAFARALDTARAMGWTIAAADLTRGTIEATDQTFWFGFKDDIVVRVRADSAGSVIDVRSLSRIGRSDVGTNARRIRAYRERLNER
ncbi:MAG: DUF1499 domain-containing protein [Alphaproteobacteria bacterium]